MKLIQRNCLMTILVIIFIFVGCSSRHLEVLYNGNFHEAQQIAMNRSENFCIVLLDTSNLTSKIYKERLVKNHIKTVFNMIDIRLPQNCWYGQWLYSISDPITCIFSPSGNLIDIIPGASRKCFDCIEQVVKTGKMCRELAYYNNFDMDKEQLIPLLNSVLLCKLDFEQGLNIELRINKLLDSINYPYIAYLKMMNLAKHSKHEAAQLVAKQLLAFDNDLELEIYPELFIAAKGVIDSCYNSKVEPVLECVTFIELGDCERGVAKPFKIKILNSGNTPLEIKEIQLSCSCVKLIGDEMYTILPKESQYVNFEFTADKDEKVERYLILKSNSIYPMHKIRIVANSS